MTYKEPFEVMKVILKVYDNSDHKYLCPVDSCHRRRKDETCMLEHIPMKPSGQCESYLHKEAYAGKRWNSWKNVWE